MPSPSPAPRRPDDAASTPDSLDVASQRGHLRPLPQTVAPRIQRQSHAIHSHTNHTCVHKLHSTLQTPQEAQLLVCCAHRKVFISHAVALGSTICQRCKLILGVMVKKQGINVSLLQLSVVYLSVVAEGLNSSFYAGWDSVFYQKYKSKPIQRSQDFIV